jgi:hypothetical protein
MWRKEQAQALAAERMGMLPETVPASALATEGG